MQTRPLVYLAGRAANTDIQRNTATDASPGPRSLDSNAGSRYCQATSTGGSPCAKRICHSTYAAALAGFGSHRAGRRGRFSFPCSQAPAWEHTLPKLCFGGWPPGRTHSGQTLFLAFFAAVAAVHWQGGISKKPKTTSDPNGQRLTRMANGPGKGEWCIFQRRLRRVGKPTREPRPFCVECRDKGSSGFTNRRSVGQRVNVLKEVSNERVIALCRVGLCGSHWTNVHVAAR
jgi:hypothetical protein